MAGLPHFANSQAAINNYEPIYLNQFEVIITPPEQITQNVELLVEHILTLKGLPELTPTDTVSQYYKFAVRKYAAAKPKQTDAQLTVTFEVNLNEDNDMYIYNILRGWSDIIYDPLNGRQGLKRDYIGEIYVAHFNKAGDIFREWKFSPVFMFGGLTETDLDYTGEEIYKLTAQFQADAFKETRIGSLAI